MAHWILKADPDDYGFADLARDGRTRWDGISNALAQKHLRAMKRGDECLVYETGKRKALVGRARIASAPRPEAGDPRRVTVEVACGSPLARPVPLAEIKADPAFAELALVRQGRLSVVPVDATSWQRLLAMAKAEA
jgi:predicted RNA-binding protein with PUA-like domain